MSEKDRKEIAEMVKKAKYLAENDPQGFMLAKIHGYSESEIRYGCSGRKGQRECVGQHIMDNPVCIHIREVVQVTIKNIV